MKIFDLYTHYIFTIELYLQTLGLPGLLKVILTKVTNPKALIGVKRSDCRFPFTLRLHSSDVQAFKQIFVEDAYNFLVQIQPSIIVDAGANIGLASIYFANKYPEAKIIAIEPEQNNFQMLKKNVEPYANIIPLQAALWHKNEEIEIIDPGRGEWGFVIQNKDLQKYSSDLQHDNHQTVIAMTVNKLINEYNLERINIFKIDIEGAEKEVFSNSATWIDKVDSLIVELHEYLKPGCNRSFYNGSGGFDQEWYQGENIVLTKQNYLKKCST
ncbi:hypothetical protein C7H19_06205 [Aphanothece hegewaldii CCALA 016]|uniref:Methyltransferase FkbM domain-containing protein n=1 Tax=Aphanothece hegewaldii CCALA 016 TaxID=2107694 RepID=A0A2T1M056_9CHRO|nr:FkbM family methyltransferase [Aphanothece hegewaldii]PSF38061.1 hypothetical protein C7H19_06205 [Aphanothece hegewaldii CCALA 016]